MRRRRLCENFLYGFKAAPRAACAADSDGSAALPLRSRAAGLRRPVGWRERQRAGPLKTEEVTEPRPI
jgi:hypothetical protein